MEYTAKDIRVLREETGRPIVVIKRALHEAGSLDEARQEILTHSEATCRYEARWLEKTYRYGETDDNLPKD